MSFEIELEDCCNKIEEAYSIAFTLWRALQHSNDIRAGAAWVLSNTLSEQWHELQRLTVISFEKKHKVKVHCRS